MASGVSEGNIPLEEQHFIGVHEILRTSASEKALAAVHTCNSEVHRKFHSNLIQVPYLIFGLLDYAPNAREYTHP